MTGHSKLVALALAIILLALPAAALSSCWLHMAGTEKCNPDCPMMKAHLSPVSIHQAPMGNSCCQISSGKPVQPSGPPAPTNVSIRVSPAANASVPNVVSVAVRAFLPDLLPRISGSSLQAALCTFVI